MSANRVEVIDVFLGSFQRLIEGWISRHFQLGFDGPKTRFHEGVVVAVSRATHALLHVSTLQNLAVLLTGSRLTIGPYRILQSAQWESKPHFRHGKAAGYHYSMGAKMHHYQIVKDQNS